MPKRNDLNTILIIGSGPIVIGQACEFDYSGVQAIKALKEEGYKVILVNSNPATIMTDPEFADVTYIEPITPEYVEKIIEKERPCALLPTMGGQTALNVALALEENGVLKKYNVELIGAKTDSIMMAEDRDLFKKAMNEIGLESAKSVVVHNINEAKDAIDQIGLPVILRPSRTLGGSGGGVVKDKSEILAKVTYALQQSPNSEVLIEESLTGWKEFELEVMRDLKDNVVIICGIENFDPMGVHTGDSITVAPIQTLTDKEYQALRDASIKIIRKIGVDTGGSNVQFALNPEDGRIIVIEMNPRVSRSSALASKATGFPIAKIAAKLAIGYTLDEIPNDITKETPASFEPSIDYVIVKIPRFNFEKFPTADKMLGTQMKSVGEVMSFGRTFKEAMQKALCSMDQDSYGFDYCNKSVATDIDWLETVRKPTSKRIWEIGEYLKTENSSIEALHKATAIDLWFLNEINEIIETEKYLKNSNLNQISRDYMYQLKQDGFSDKRISQLLKVNQFDVRNKRKELGVLPNFKAVDTCAAEFSAETPYLYSTYDVENEATPTDKKKIIILGSGPNRIGQGIEFDYCCVHAVLALKEVGYETIMINCNPETVSTDYDTSDRLYFEPLTLESVLNIIEREKPDGVIVQFGGQTPLKLAKTLSEQGVPIIGTSVESIDFAEDREKFGALVEKLKLKQPKFETALSIDDAILKAKNINFPLMIRPSFVLGGRAMRVIYSEAELKNYFQEGIEVSNERPVLLDKYLHNAIEIDVDVVSDGEESIVIGVMEHIERTGVHSGDSSCSLPPRSLDAETIVELERQAVLLAENLKVSGLMNVQFAVTKDKEIFIIEVNPRASRTVPFVSKAVGIPYAKIAAKVMSGIKLRDIKNAVKKVPKYFALKACVFPFSKFQGVDTILGPEMKSTGEVMGLDYDFGTSFLRAQISASHELPKSGLAFLSISNSDKEELITLYKELTELGFELIATSGTCKYLLEKGFAVQKIKKVHEGSPNIVDLITSGSVSIVFNTPEGSQTLLDSRSIRLAASENKVPTFTTMAASFAAIRAIAASKENSNLGVRSIQEYHGDVFN
jgi:carbamoyl-phosphate synthase large subunit